MSEQKKRRIEPDELLRGAPLGEFPAGALKLGPAVFLPLRENPGRIARTLGYLLLVLRVPLRALFVALLYLLKGLIGSVVACSTAVWWLLSRLLAIVFLPFTGALELTRRAYPGILDGALRARWAVLPLAFALFVLALLALPLLGTDLVPDLAQGTFSFRMKLSEGTPLNTTSEVLERIEARLVGDGRFERVFSLVGSLPSSASGRRTRGENLAQLSARKHPRRTLTGVEALCRMIRRGSWTKTCKRQVFPR